MAAQVARQVGGPAEGFGAQRAGVGPEAGVAQPVPREVVGEAEEAATGGAGQGRARGSSSPPASASASTSAPSPAPATAPATVRRAALGRWRGLWIHACAGEGKRWRDDGGRVAEREMETEIKVQKVRYSAREGRERATETRDRDRETEGQRDRHRETEGQRQRDRDQVKQKDRTVSPGEQDTRQRQR